MSDRKITILVLHGPNLNLLSRRNHKHYGVKTLAQINALLRAEAKKQNCHLIIRQSNYEGRLIDIIQKHARLCGGILINPAALTHYSIALRDALEDTGLPIAEVHLSDISQRENFRKISVIKGIASIRVMGKKEMSYILGLRELVKKIKKL